MEEKENGFSYTYNAAQQQEVERIRNKYVPQEKSGLERLRELDRSVNRKAQINALTLGVIGTLILGTGMSFAMTDLAEILPLSEGLAMLVGVLIGVVGLVLVALAYPVYNRTLKKQRQKIAPEILRLSDELLKQ